MIGDGTEDETPLEIAIGNLMVEFYKLRKAGEIQEEYDSKGALLNMLSEDRNHIRKTYPGIKI